MTPWWDEETYHFAVFNDTNGKFMEFGGTQTWTIKEWEEEYPEIPEGFKIRVSNLLPDQKTKKPTKKSKILKKLKESLDELDMLKGEWYNEPPSSTRRSKIREEE